MHPMDRFMTPLRVNRKLRRGVSTPSERARPVSEHMRHANKRVPSGKSLQLCAVVAKVQRRPCRMTQARIYSTGRELLSRPTTNPDHQLLATSIRLCCSTSFTQSSTVITIMQFVRQDAACCTAGAGERVAHRSAQPRTCCTASRSGSKGPMVPGSVFSC